MLPPSPPEAGKTPILVTIVMRWYGWDSSSRKDVRPSLAWMVEILLYSHFSALSEFVVGWKFDMEV